jgi:hypothetical protein
MLVRFRLKLARSRIVAAPSVVICEPLVAVEEIDVSLRRKVGIPANTRNPHQYLRYHEVQT